MNIASNNTGTSNPRQPRNSFQSSKNEHDTGKHFTSWYLIESSNRQSIEDGQIKRSQLC